MVDKKGVSSKISTYKRFLGKTANGYVENYIMVIYLLIKLLLLPVVSGISYEIIKWAGRSDNAVVTLLSKPGMWLQKLTTREPDDEQIEVAIAALSAVIPENREDDKW